ncbi:hypothetical protein RIF29_18068 [Crotalaria pallida]|uniref:Viral late gene transcription factor 3 zinc ribbon domain-containing protein n=1 Tax=Crotalaria pallida TaxID=3830 RepID=A0AAN9FJQ3_CROPI
MEAAAASLTLPSFTTSNGSNSRRTKSSVVFGFPVRKSCNISVKNARRRNRVALAVTNDEVNTIIALDPAPVELTWQILAGAIAGVTPFVVAGIEFSKRIIAQRRCEVCGGSGLVLMEEKEYVRCPGCGGFLPWQSWKRFFSG